MFTGIVGRYGPYTEVSNFDVSAVRVYVDRFTCEFPMHHTLRVQVFSTLKDLSAPVLQDYHPWLIHLFQVPRYEISGQE
jgi:hypothetical protein